MASLVHTLYDGYTYLTDDLDSPLTKDWFLAGKPLNLILILASYLYFCKTLGPWYMKDKKPYKLTTVIKIYNLFQIFISLYLFYEGTRYVFFTDFNFRCQGLNDPSSLEAKQIANAIWVFYMVKIMDLMDTVFFVLRKSNRQITQLHLHHHTLMPVVSWISVTYIPGGQCVLVGHINSLVHAVMYTYYLLAGLGDEYKKYLWWKKYLTMLQLVQFAIIGAHSTNSLFYSCSYPFFFKILACFYAIMFINMFGQFYYNNYIKSKNNATKNGMINEKKTATNAHGKTPKARNAMNSFNMINK